MRPFRASADPAAGGFRADAIADATLSKFREQFAALAVSSTPCFHQERQVGIEADRASAIVLRLQSFPRNAHPTVAEHDVRQLVQAAGGFRQILNRTQTANKAVRFTVLDSGEGLPPVEPTKLFDPFFTTKPGGVGIKLDISRSIVEAAQGELLAEPNSARGVVFHFTVHPRPAVANGQ